MKKRNVFLLALLSAVMMFALTATAVEGFSVVSETGDSVVTLNGKIQMELVSETEDTSVLGKIWLSSDPTAAAVDAKGMVTAKKTGVATVSCMSADGRTVYAECDIEVIKGVQSLKISEQSKELLLCADEEKGMVRLSATVLPEDTYYKNVIWASSNEEVATVDADGNVAAVAEGKAEITATSTDPKKPATVKCTVTVKLGVTDISVTGEETVVYIGKPLKLTVSVGPENASKKQLKWTSSDQAVATVDANGSVTAKAVGNVVITAEATDGSGVSAQYSLETHAKIKSLKLEETAVTLLLGVGEDALKHSLKYETVPAGADDPGVEWFSSDESVVRVDTDGTLHGIMAGKATITVKSLDPDCNASAKCNVAVEQGVMVIKLDKTDELLYSGETLKLSAMTSPETAANKKIIWTSSDAEVASVDANGNVRAKSAGKITITAEAADGSGTKDECSIEVRSHVKSLKIAENPLTLLIDVGAEKAKVLTIVTDPMDAYEQGVVWSSSDESVVKIDKNGTVRAVGYGKATITAKSKDEKCTTAAKCAVVVGNKVKRLWLSPSNTKIAIGTSKRITVKVHPTDAVNKKVKWETSDPEIVTVDQNGNVRGVGIGKATVECTALDGGGEYARCSIEVVKPITSIQAVEKGTIQLNDGETRQLSIVILPEDATKVPIVWKSTNSSVCSVNDSGLIVARGGGDATITASCFEPVKKEATFKVHVETDFMLVSTGYGSWGTENGSPRFSGEFRNLSDRKIVDGVTIRYYATDVYGKRMTAEDGKDYSERTFNVTIRPGASVFLPKTVATEYKGAKEIHEAVVKVHYSNGKTSAPIVPDYRWYRF